MFNVESEGNMAKKVLVVDDEKLIVKGIRFSLEQDGMEVDCAYDGEEALSLASSNQVLKYASRFVNLRMFLS